MDRHVRALVERELGAAKCDRVLGEDHFGELGHLGIQRLRLHERAVTIYIWHFPCLFLAEILLGADGGEEALALCLVLTGIAALTLGWVEELAARRRPTLLPG